MAEVDDKVTVFDETDTDEETGILLVPAIVEKSGSFPLSNNTFRSGDDLTVLLREEA